MSLFPSKTFLCGEYAVLDGGDALVLAHSPFFESKIGSSQGFHPNSPAGILAKKYSIDTRSINFIDPHAGRGGFGGSGAEFLTVFEQVGKIASNEKFAWRAWEEYKALQLPGSAVDLLVQAYGRNSADKILKISLAEKKISPLAATLGLQLRIFHTGKKLATHANLQKPQLPFSELQSITLKATLAAQAGLGKDFAMAIQTYGEKLASLGLLAAHSKNALAALPKKPAILGAKGCGAMGADVLLVVLGEDFDLNPWAEANSLAEIASIWV